VSGVIIVQVSGVIIVFIVVVMAHICNESIDRFWRVWQLHNQGANQGVKRWVVGKKMYLQNRESFEMPVCYCTHNCTKTPIMKWWRHEVLQVSL